MLPLKLRRRTLDLSLKDPGKLAPSPKDGCRECKQETWLRPQWWSSLGKRRNLRPNNKMITKSVLLDGQSPKPRKAIMLIMTIGTNSLEEEMVVVKAMKAMLERLIKESEEKEARIKSQEEKIARLTRKLEKRPARSTAKKLRKRRGRKGIHPK